MTCIDSEGHTYIEHDSSIFICKAHFIKGIVLFLYFNSVNRIDPSKKEEDPHDIWQVQNKTS